MFEQLSEIQKKKIDWLRLSFSELEKLDKNINKDNFENEIKKYSAENKINNKDKINIKSFDEIVLENSEDILIKIRKHFEAKLKEDYFHFEINKVFIPEGKLITGNSINNVIIANQNGDVEIKNYDIIFDKIKNLLTSWKWLNVPSEIFEWIKSRGLNNVLSCVICNFYYNKSFWKVKLTELLDNVNMLNDLIRKEYYSVQNRNIFEKIISDIANKNNGV